MCDADSNGDYITGSITAERHIGRQNDAYSYAADGVFSYGNISAAIYAGNPTSANPSGKIRSVKAVGATTVRFTWHRRSSVCVPNGKRSCSFSFLSYPTYAFVYGIIHGEVLSAYVSADD